MTCRAARRVSHVHRCHNLATRGCEQYSLCLDPACPIPLDDPVLCLACCVELANTGLDVVAEPGTLGRCRCCHRQRIAGEKHICPDAFAAAEALRLAPPTSDTDTEPTNP